MHKELFGQTIDGHDIYLYHLSNRHGLNVAITNYGGIVVSIEVPDRNGSVALVVPWRSREWFFGFS